jgi:hypothetical protein
MLNGRLGIDVPDQLSEVASRHELHITELVSQLSSYGMDAQMIEHSVDTLIGSYRAELLEAIKALGGMDSV